MARLQDMAAQRKDLYMIDPRVIEEEPGWNVRIDGPELQAHIRTLCDSIKEIGVQEPLTVYMRGDVPVLTNGHCRLRAVKLAIDEGAEVKAVPVRCEERGTNEADRVLSMLTRNSGKPLGQLEQAEVVKRLLALGWTKPQVVSKAGFTGVHLDNLLLLASAPSTVTQMVRDGQVSARTAVDVMRKEKEQAPEVLQTALKTAKSQGKDRATAKHLPKAPGRETDWQKWGPKLKEAIEAIRDADSVDERTLKIEAAEKLLWAINEVGEM